MAKRIEAIRKSNPELAEREDIKAAADDADRQGALASFASSKAGEIMREGLIDNLAVTIGSIAQGWRTASHIELMALCATLEDRIAMVRTFALAESNRDAAVEALTELTS